MAACIEIVRGPDIGWKYRMTGGDVRIGRGAGHAIRIPDPAWPVGSLRVQHRQGGYLVTNHLPHPVYLDEKPLGPEQQRTWYAGGVLQPTATTLLRLVVSEGDAESDAEAGPVVAQAPVAKKPTISLNMILVALLALSAPVLWFLMQPQPAADPVARMQRNVVLLWKSSDEPARPDRERLIEILREAVLAESQRSPAAARERYQQARKLIDSLRRNNGLGGEFAIRLDNDVAQRCHALTPPTNERE